MCLGLRRLAEVGTQTEPEEKEEKEEKEAEEGEEEGEDRDPKEEKEEQKEKAFVVHSLCICVSVVSLHLCVYL